MYVLCMYVDRYRHSLRLDKPRADMGNPCSQISLPHVCTSRDGGDINFMEVKNTRNLAELVKPPITQLSLSLSLPPSHTQLLFMLCE